MSGSKLIVNHLKVFGKGRFLYDQKFHKGVNIIRGANTTGKSTIMDLLSYGLGAVITSWTEEQLLCDWVLVEVTLNKEVFCLKRDVSETGQEKMQIFEGDIHGALNNQEKWHQYPFRRSDGKQSFSQKIFELLGLPQHKTDEKKNLTLHQILRLIYVDQLSSTLKLLKEDISYDNVTLRRAIGEYMLGIDDLAAHNLRQDLITANKDFEVLNGELKAIYKMFGNDTSAINIQLLEAELTEVIGTIEKLNQDKKNILSLQRADIDEKSAERIKQLSEEIELNVKSQRNLEIEKSEISNELLDTKLFLNSLLTRKSSLENSKNTYSSLGGVDFKYCPRCLEPIYENNHLHECCLCKSPEKKSDRNSLYNQFLDEINFQISESKGLIKKFEEKLHLIEGRIPSLKRSLTLAKNEYQDLSSIPDNKDALLSSVSMEIGFNKNKIMSLNDKREFVSKIEVLQEEKQIANGRIFEIGDKLTAINAQQEKRHIAVYQSIESLSKKLLASDGGYETVFDDADEVSFDFAKDKMYVNGRSKFSASSMVILKNSIRFAIFLHSVNDQYSRFPNLLLMDNIEDKGMVSERSQTFQHLIVSECSKLENEFQLIFTTSMIAPDLDVTPLCIGPKYLKGMHTLDFSV